MRVSEWDVDCLQFQGVIELAPIGGDHVGGGTEASGLLELRHDLTSREAGFGPTRVLGVSEYAFQVLADLDGFLEKPGPVGVEGDAGLGEAGGEGAHGFDFAGGTEYAPLELEVLEAETFLDGFGLADDAFRRKGFLVAEKMPSMGGAGFVAIAERSLTAVTDEEEVTEHLDLGTLLAFAEQRGDRLRLELTEEIEQGGLDRRDSVNRHAEVKGLQAAATGVAVGEGGADRREELFVVSDFFPNE